MNWFKLSLQLNKFPINRARKLLEKIGEIPEDYYEDYVESKKKETLEFHLKNNTFYRDFFQENSYTRWEDVPVLSKSDLQIPLQSRLSSGFRRINTYVGKTSGSSGAPFVFAKDRFCHALSWAGFDRCYNWHGINLNRSLQARFYGIPLDRYGNIREHVKDRLSLRRRFPIFDLSEPKMEGFLRRFKKRSFEYINGYTSAILLFSKFLYKKGLVLKDVCPRLRLCIVTSERLFPEDKVQIEKAMGVPVLNEYGANEVGLIAFENPLGEWVVNAEDLHIEILDDNNQPVPQGKEGRIIITSFYNMAHPIIRYDIGDSGILSENSSSKKPILEKLIGRTNNVAYLPNGKAVPGLTFYYVTKTIIEDTGNVKEFVISQTAKDSFKINYVSEIPFSKIQIEKIIAAIEKYVGKDLNISLERKTSLKRTKNGKLKQFTVDF